MRKNLNLFANLRPAILYPELAGASTLKPEVVSGLDILIIRELTGDIYFGQPRGVRIAPDGAFKGEREGFDTMRYAETEVRRIAQVVVAFDQQQLGVHPRDREMPFSRGVSRVRGQVGG